MNKSLINQLHELAADYERAELTVVWLHDQDMNEDINVFSVVELCPTEQERSVDVRDIDNRGNPVPMVRKSIAKNKTVYLTRIFFDDIQDALDLYCADGIRKVAVNGGIIRLASVSNLVEEPPAAQSVLIPSNLHGSTGVGAVLPRRRTDLRVWMQLDMEGKTRCLFDEQEWDSLCEFVNVNLGIDFNAYREYTGAFLLCGSNPILYNVSTYLSQSERQILVYLHERYDKCIAGGRIELNDIRPQGKGFRITKEITDSQMLLEIPYSPYELQTRIFGPNGTLLAEKQAGFMRSFHIATKFATGKRVVILHNEDEKEGGSETFEIELFSPRNIIIGDDQPGVEHFFQQAQERRVLDELEKSRRFIYFPGKTNESARYATGIIREIVSDASQRLIICDPYLGAEDVKKYVLFVPYKGVSIKLLSSAKFLKKSFKDSRSEGEKLLEVIKQIKEQDQTLNIDCRVLKGRERSPVHDRFIVVNNDVYILGSSLNEFGSRATTLFKVPDPNLIINEMESWWQDSHFTISLEEWISNRP